jgi:Skp family chaperone for outer membrane proteins
MILLVAAAAGLAIAGFVGSQLSAQTGGTAAPAASSGPTRVAVVNIGLVFSKYDKAKTFKTELEETLKPYKGQAETLRKDILSFKESIEKKDYSKFSKEQFEAGIVDRQRKMEDLDREVRRLIGKKQEDQLVQLWKEVNTHIQAYAQSNGIHVVMGYGDPMTAEELHAFPNINRKMQGMDLGAAVPLFVGQGLDISNDVVRSLNDYYQRCGGARPASTSGAILAPKGY